FKVSDLYLNFETVRRTLLDGRLVQIVSDVLNDRPILINTLSFQKGSEQPNHIDTLFMTPVSFQKVVAVWIALEDVSADSGPLRYYPGSHRIPAFQFSNGGYHVIPEEMTAWNAYIESQLQEKTLNPKFLLAEKGDLFL